MLLLPLIVIALPTARAFVAFSGDACNGAQGNSVPCDGSCHSFAGRHSFDTAQDLTCVSLWTASGCIGQRFNYTNRFSGQCTVRPFQGRRGVLTGVAAQNVNTGTNIQSFRCYRGAGGCAA